MLLLEEAIKTRGKVYDSDVLKIDGFLNHCLDVSLLCEIGKEFFRIFHDCGANKILTIEASGIGIACITSQYFGNLPVLFAKKSKTANISSDYYSTKVISYTHNKKVYDVVVSKEYLTKNDRVLIIDDFLAKGNALLGMIDLCKQAGAIITGAGICVEKSYQDGGNIVRNMGYNVESLAKIKSMDNGIVTFC